MRADVAEGLRVTVTGTVVVPPDASTLTHGVCDAADHGGSGTFEVKKRFVVPPPGPTSRVDGNW
jgi:hypothetical protein